MPDREKVIKGLECCSQMAGEACGECPYASECEEGEGLLTGSAHLAANALTLLREQEAVEPELRMSKHGFRQWIVCGNCYEKIYVGDNYCRHCGKKVK